ncbi:hypothetical protein [Nocardia seriolae]|uniref:hypothetical protein n=1 Tax=Nocardia seriolae TaxID=37332 RepID=UPI0029540DE7|nr:hypothetical protein [Nocardia seriolae]BEK89235.1 hypothetical protein NSERKGN1266_51860 [Nocardia seriolae]
MGSKGFTLDDCGITELVTAVETLSDAILHGDLNAFADGDVVELMKTLETCKRSALGAGFEADRGSP